jgi:ATP-dependent Clp protease ATP-binding subunit ClpC
MDANAVRHSESLLIAWRLAELEATHLRRPELEPVHFFLSLLKLVEMDVSAILLDKTTLSTDRIQEGASHVETLRHAFTTAGVDSTRTRRRLRKLLPPGDTAGEDIKNIRRSPATRTIFTKAEQMLAEAPLPVLQPLHLLEAILAVECPFILQGLDMVGGDIAKLKETVAHALGLTESTVEPRTERTPDKKGAIVAQNKKVPKGLADRLGRDLTELAKNGSLSPVIGRKNEMRSLVQTMLRSRKNNAILIGEAGVGKTGIVEGLAQKIA